MRVAIPVFENRISPRFDFAPGFSFYDIEGKRVSRSGEVSCEGWSESERASRLKGLGVDTVICGGLPGYMYNILTAGGIRVIPWVAGDVMDALSLFVRGQLNIGAVISPGRGKESGWKKE